MATSYYAVIMAGGRGERFWPLSTSKKPKQLLSLIDDKPLIAQAIDRLSGFIPPENVVVITNADLIEATRRAAPLLPAENVVGEPMGRDTAAAVACGAAWVKAKDPAGVFVVLTADQVIGNLNVFVETLQGGMELALQHDILVTIGIKPTFPSTQFGYIEAGDLYEEKGAISFCKTRRFVEKPDKDRATAYLETGQFYWNSGMFIWSVTSLEKAFSMHCPELFDLMKTLTTYAKENRLHEGMKATYPNLNKISVDYALMEKADNIIMACGTFAWDDVGSWPALENYFDQDLAGNTKVGQVEVIDSSENIVISQDRLTALIGVKDLVVVQAEGVTLVCPKDRSEDVKQMVVALRENGQFDDVL